MKLAKGIGTFFICMGVMTIAGLAYNHIHWVLGLAILGGGVYFLIKYRHWLFPE